MKNNPRQAAKDMVEALRKVFKKYSLTTRTEVWDTLTSDKGKKSIRPILIHPDKPISPLMGLTFKEWVIEEANIEQIAAKAKIDIEGLDLKQLQMGFKVEQEHDGRMGKDTQITTNDADTLKVAVAHLREKPNYYTMLKKVEND